MISQSEAIKRALSINGSVTPKETVALYELAKTARGPIVEIGAIGGRSTAAMAFGAMHGDQHVYSVSPRNDHVRSELDTIGLNGQVTVSPEWNVKHGGNAMVFANRGINAFHHDNLVESGGVLVSHGDGSSECATNLWIPSSDIDDLHVVTRRHTAQRHNIMLAMPGASLGWNTVLSVLELANGHHEVQTTNSGNGWDDLNIVWANALNAYERGEITHFAQLHSDVSADGHWLDLLLDDMDRHGLDLVSAICPIKDIRGVTSSGIADPNDRWGMHKRLTVREVCDMPWVFGAEEIGCPGMPLAHNTGCFACDLRNPIFRQTDGNGRLAMAFEFPTRIVRNQDGVFVSQRESEDWFFSRKLHELGGKSAFTRRVRIQHRGVMDFNNWEPWGSYQDGDEDTSAKWQEVSS